MSRVVDGVGVTLVVVLLGLMFAGWLFGGSELPPPRWTVHDLSPIPDEEHNAWYAIMRPKEPPDWDRWLLDDHERVSPNDLAAAREDLAQPEVVALLARVPQVLERSDLAVPDDEDSTQLLTWRYWLALSLSSEIERAPAEAVRTLARTLPMWSNCANSARGVVVYMICAKHARQDLTLMLGATEYLPTGADKMRDMIEVAVREAPSLTTENVMRARYIESYDLLSLPIDQQRFWVDKRATIRRFNRLLSPSPSKAFCDAPQETNIYKALYTYNYAGDLFATNAARYSCVGLDQVNAATQSVVEARRELLAALVNE